MLKKAQFSKKDKHLLTMAENVIRLEAKAVLSVLEELDEDFLNAVTEIYNSKGRVIVMGMGKSGAIGRKLAATLASTGTSSYFLHPSDGLHGDVGLVHRDDVVICLSKSGDSEEIFALLPTLKQLAVPIILITANANSQLSKHSNVVLTIPEIEEACPHGLAPTTSSTAMLALGDALAIALLEKRQFTKEDFAFLHPGGALGKRLLLRVDDVMETDELIPILPEIAVMKDAVLQMAAKRGICIILNSKSEILGIITNGDLNRLVKQNEHFFHIPVKDVMNQKPKTVLKDTLAYTALKKMEEFRIMALPVLDERKKLIGVIHLHDIMRAGVY